MDFRRPVQALIPGAQGRVLAVLAETSAELSTRTIARLSGVSAAQVSRVLPALVSLGLVERREVPPSVLFRLVKDHVVASAVLEIARARENVLRKLGDTAATWMPAAVSIVVFGSIARGDAGSDSDVDVLIVRPASVEEGDEAWASAVESWRRHAARLTGNPVRIVEIGESEVGPLMRSRRPLWQEVGRDGIVVAGRRLSDLKAS